MGLLEHWFTKFFFWKLYREYSGKGWSVVCKIPGYLNVAFPDDSVQYFICTFPKGSNVRIRGKIPPANTISYMALTVYNTVGLPMGSLYDDQISQKNGRYDIRLGVDIPLPDSSYFCVILRFYMTKSIDRLNTEYLPDLVLEGNLLPSPSLSLLRENSSSVASEIVYFFEKRSIPEFQGSQFFVPSQTSWISLFVNKDAVYMVAKPDKTPVLRIQGHLSHEIGRNDPIRFIGFMCCNLLTTQTDQSVGHSSLPTNYTIWVAYSKKEAESRGFRDGDVLLLWKKANQHPVIIYREVRVDKKGLASLSFQDTVSTETCQKIMGRNFPIITQFN